MITMSILVLLGYIAGALGLVATVTAAVIVVRSTTAKTTSAEQKDLIDILTKAKTEHKEQIKDLQAKQLESIKSVSELQGQVNVLRDIPLKEISADLRSIATEMKNVSDNQATIAQALAPAHKQ